MKIELKLKPIEHLDSLLKSNMQRKKFLLFGHKQEDNTIGCSRPTNKGKSVVKVVDGDFFFDDFSTKYRYYADFPVI